MSDGGEAVSSEAGGSPARNSDAAPPTPGSSEAGEGRPAPSTPGGSEVGETRQPPSTPGGSEAGDAKRAPSALKQQFVAFAKYGDTKSDGTAITLSQSDKWMKQARVIDGRTITTTDTAIAFKKHKQQKLTFKEFLKFLDELAKSKNVSPNKMREKLGNCGVPGHKNTSSPGSKTSVYDRLCDVSKYGASHRQRFDEHGRGRGIAGRRDVQQNSGYVHGYKNKDTYPEQR